MKKDMIDHLSLTRQERLNITKKASKVIRDSERHMRERGIIIKKRTKREKWFVVNKRFDNSNEK